MKKTTGRRLDVVLLEKEMGSFEYTDILVEEEAQEVQV